MGPIEIGLGIFVVPILLVVGKLLHAADEVAEAIRDAAVGAGPAGSLVTAAGRGESRDDPAYAAAVDGVREDVFAPATIEQLFGKRLPN